MEAFSWLRFPPRMTLACVGLCKTMQHIWVLSFSICLYTVCAQDLRRREHDVRHLETGVEVAPWVLGIKAQSSEREVSTLDHLLRHLSSHSVTRLVFRRIFFFFLFFPKLKKSPDTAPRCLLIWGDSNSSWCFERACEWKFFVYFSVFIFFLIK